MQKGLQRSLSVLQLGRKIQQQRLPEPFLGSCKTRHAHQHSAITNEVLPISSALPICQLYHGQCESTIGSHAMRP